MLSKSQLKYIQSLHHKKFREEHKAFLTEGTKMLEEALEFAHDKIERIYAVPDWIAQHGSLLGSSGHLLQEISPVEMEKISVLHTAPGVLLLMKQLSPEEQHYSGLTLVLDSIKDPGNLGTIIRSADWFGVKNIICGTGTADAYNPKVIQSSMGSIFRVNLLYIDLLSVLEKHKDIPVMVSHLAGTDLPQVAWPQNAFLVIGNESKGVADEIANKASLKIKIPGYGHAESLNASIATAILLYAWRS